MFWQLRITKVSLEALDYEMLARKAFTFHQRAKYNSVPLGLLVILFKGITRDSVGPLKAHFMYTSVS
jgi:hypothetical protein